MGCYGCRKLKRLLEDSEIDRSETFEACFRLAEEVDKLEGEVIQLKLLIQKQGGTSGSA